MRTIFVFLNALSSLTSRWQHGPWNAKTFAKKRLQPLPRVVTVDWNLFGFLTRCTNQNFLQMKELHLVRLSKEWEGVAWMETFFCFLKFLNESFLVSEALINLQSRSNYWHGKCCYSHLLVLCLFIFFNVFCVTVVESAKTSAPHHVSTTERTAWIAMCTKQVPATSHCEKTNAVMTYFFSNCHTNMWKQVLFSMNCIHSQC